VSYGHVSHGRASQNMPTLDEHNQQCLQKMVNAAEKFVSARDLLHQECSDKFKHANESDARASIRSTVVGKGKIMSFEDIEEARAKTLHSSDTMIVTIRFPPNLAKRSFTDDFLSLPFYFNFLLHTTGSIKSVGSM
jgi:hypothetical protein